MTETNAERLARLEERVFNEHERRFEEHERRFERLGGAVEDTGKHNLTELERGYAALKKKNDDRDAKDKADAEAVVAAARSHAAALVTARKARRWDVAKIAITLALSAVAGAVTSQWRHFVAFLKGLFT